MPLFPLYLVSALCTVAYRIFYSALLMQETGLKYREEYRLYTNKPQCQGQTGFISIGFTECYFALVSMGYGTLLSLAVLVFEHLWHRRYTYMYVYTSVWRRSIGVNHSCRSTGTGRGQVEVRATTT